MELIKGDIIRLPDGRALPVGSALEDGLLKNNLKNGVYVMREGVKHPVFPPFHQSIFACHLLKREEH